MQNNPGKIFAPSKVGIYREKIDAYLKGERIYPTTIELDLTQLCTRACVGCPFAAPRKAGLTLQMPFLDRLFSILGPHTPGMVLSGGEPTIVAHFGETVALAKEKGFREVAVISNGANIDSHVVQDALLEHVTSIRISLYDWYDGDSASFTDTMRKIERLCNRAAKEGSRLEVAASILTRKELSHRYDSVGLRALSAGINWLYFHPYCIDWDRTYPTQADQTGVLEAIENLARIAPEGSNIQVPYERYYESPLYFDKLHGAHFLIQVGADGINYAGPECKYETDSALLNLNEYLEDDFLWHPRRLERLNAINSGNYRFIGTRHRPPMFSDYIQGLMKGNTDNGNGSNSKQSSCRFTHPDII